MKVDPNFSSALDQVRPGCYDARVEDIEEHQSKKGTRCARVGFKIVGGDFNNRWVPCILPLEGKAAGFFRKFVQAIKPDYIEGELDTTELLGKAVKLLVARSSRVEGAAHSYLKISIFPADYDLTSAVVQQEGV